MKFRRPKARIAPMLEESDFVCSRELAQQFFRRLSHGWDTHHGDAGVLYLFSAEKRRVRVTVLPGPARST